MGGGFCVNRATLRFFYSMHFLLPFIILCLMLFHIIFLHETGSTRSIYLHVRETKLKFNFSFTVKDAVNISIFFSLYIFVLFFHISQRIQKILCWPTQYLLHCIFNQNGIFFLPTLYCARSLINQAVWQHQLALF